MLFREIEVPSIVAVVTPVVGSFTSESTRSSKIRDLAVRRKSCRFPRAFLLNRSSAVPETVHWNTVLVFSRETGRRIF
jgi:hypothetical protein